MKILITGVAGFIASNLVCYLVKKYPEYQFVGIDKISYCSSTKNFEEILEYKNFKFIKADFTDIIFMEYIFDNEKIDTVLHLGAYTHVDMSFGNSIIYTQNNILGTHVLLEISKKFNIKRFILCSTDEVYGNNEGQSNENTILQATNMYAATKAAAEQIANSYYHSFKFPLIITRANNLIGKHQYPEKLIPKFILKICKGEDLTIQGTGEQKRCFLHVNDLCRAFDIILHKGVIGETYNIGCKDEYTVLEVTNKLLELFPNEKRSKIVFIEDRPFNDQRYFISSNKIEALGWKQEIFFDEALKLTVDWYIANQNYFN
jgi:dTDP-glucose 4,6-dehydratase